MKICGLEIIDLALYHKKNLIFADLHLGYEEILNMQGMMIPRFQYKKIIEKIEKIFSMCDAETAVINGDLKHGFGGISSQEWKETLDFLDFLGERFKKIILVKGNHDILTGKIAEKKNVEMKEYYISGGILIAHGHVIPEIGETLMDKIKTIVIAHDHPCVGLRESGRIEKVKCFLSGKWRNKNLIVMPSLNFITEGTDILQENMLSPFLAEISEFNVYGIENFEVFPFGKVKNMRNNTNTFEFI